MVDLALRSPGAPVSLSSIALRQKISLSYLEQLFGKLRRNGLVLSFRGPGGGYTLALPGESITVADIVAAVDGMDDASQDHAHGTSWEGSNRCDASTLWSDVKSKMIEILGSITLKKLVDEQLANGFSTQHVQPVHRGISSEPVLKPVRTNAPNSVFAFATSLSKSPQMT
jgi:Rrf2 family iron-sulfur cluster assembly transcriptional regulator